MVAVKLAQWKEEGKYVGKFAAQHTSVCLAMKYEADLEKAELAGLLHDCAKELPEKKLIKICRDHGEKISTMEFKQPFLLHGK